MADPALKTASSRIIWFIGLLISSIGGTVSVARELKGLKEEDLIYWKIFYIILLILLGIVIVSCIIIVIAYKPLSKRYEEWRYSRQLIKSDFLLNHIKVCMEYITDDGDLVSISRAEHITNIKSTKTLSTILETEGEIINPYGINSAFTTLANNRIRIYSLLNYTQIEKGGEYYSNYSLTVKNGFPNKEEYWIFGVSNFCKFYELDVIIPSTRKLMNAKLQFKETPNEAEKSANSIDLSQSGWLDDDSTSIMRTQKYSSIVISVHISTFKESHKYKLVWELA